MVILLVGCDEQPAAPTSAGTTHEQERDITSAYVQADAAAEAHPMADPVVTDTAGESDAADAQLAADIQLMFDEIASLMEAGDYNSVADRLDIGRMIGEIASHGVSVGSNASQRADFGRGLRIGMVKAVARADTFIPGIPHVVRHARRIPETGEVLVYTSLLDPSGYVMKVRWWLTHDGDTWRIYDYEELSTSIRVSVLMVAMLGTVNGGELAPWVAEFQTLAQATPLIQAEQWGQARELLESLELAGAPDDVHAMKMMLLASALIGEMRYEEASGYIDRMEQVKPDIPMIDYQRAAVCIAYEQFDKALEHTDRYIDRIGGDADIYLLRMWAFHGLDRHDDAVKVGELFIQGNPTAESLIEFGLILGEDQKSRIADLIVGLGITADRFELIGESFNNENDLPALRAAVQGFERVDPSNIETAYYDALVKMLDGEYEASADRLRPAIRQITDPEARGPYLGLYFSSMRQAGKARQAYDESDDPGDAFIQLASDMYWDDQIETLRELSEAHIQRVPADPWGHYYAGVCMTELESYADADRHFADAMQRATDDTMRDDIRYEWVDCLNRAGRWRDVPERVGRDDATIDQVMWHLVNQGDPQALDEFLAAHAGARPTIGRAYVYSLQGAHAMAADYLATYREALRTEDSIYSYDDLAVRSLIRAERFVDALKLAKESTAYDDDPYYELIVHIASGETDQAIDTAQACLDTGYYTVEEFYDDDLILEHVNRYRMKAFREKFPPPVEEQAPVMEGVEAGSTGESVQ